MSFNEKDGVALSRAVTRPLPLESGDRIVLERRLDDLRAEMRSISARRLPWIAIGIAIAAMILAAVALVATAVFRMRT